MMQKLLIMLFVVSTALVAQEEGRDPLVFDVACATTLDFAPETLTKLDEMADDTGLDEDLFFALTRGLQADPAYCPTRSLRVVEDQGAQQEISIYELVIDDKQLKGWRLASTQVVPKVVIPGVADIDDEEAEIEELDEDAQVKKVSKKVGSSGKKPAPKKTKKVVNKRSKRPVKRSKKQLNNARIKRKVPKKRAKQQVKSKKTTVKRAIAA